MTNIVTADFTGNKQTITISNAPYQWSYGQILRITGLDLPDGIEIHFSLNEKIGIAYRVPGTNKGGATEVKIPQFIFENEGTRRESYKGYVFIYPSDPDSGETTHKIILNIKTRPRPEEYIYNEEELATYKALEKRILDLEENQTSDETIKDAVEDYLERNPVEIEVDEALSETSENPVANKAVAKKIKEVEGKIPADYVSEEELESKGYLTEHQPLDDYAKKSELPSKLPASDVYSWAKQPTKPTYTAQEVDADASGSAKAALEEAKKYTDDKVKDVPKGEVIDVDSELKEYMTVAKPKIRQAIINKGGNVLENDSLGDYAERISEIPNGVYAAEDLPPQTSLIATYNPTQPEGITLTFADVGAAGYLIVRKENAKPETSADGVVVYNGAYKDGVVDNDVALNTIYYYRIYPRNDKNQYQSLEEESVASCEYKSRETQKQAKDLELDDVVTFGKYNNQIFNWAVVDTKDGIGPILAAEQNCGNKQWDCPENAADNANPITARKNSGNNRWAFSNVRQWLNSSAGKGEWYVAQHEYDVAPGYKTEAGFLNEFTDAEKENIAIRTNRCILDANDGGGTETVRDRIWLPSSYEVGKEVTEGGYNFEKYDGTNATTIYQSNWWLRSIDRILGDRSSACFVRYVNSGGNLSGVSANSYVYAVRPFCQLKGDAWLVWSDTAQSYVLADDSQRTWEA